MCSSLILWLHLMIMTVQNLAPDFVMSIRWQLLYVSYLGFIFVWKEEMEMCHQSNASEVRRRIINNCLIFFSF